MSGTHCITYVGIGALSLLANVSYAGMRAQNRSDTEIQRILAFCCGFPHTLLTFLVVDKGSNRAYGVHLPPST